MERSRFTSAEFGDGLRHGVVRAAVAAAVIAGFLGGAILVDGVKISLTDNAAFAKGGNGGGNGGGRGGGRGGGNGHGGGNKGGHSNTADAGKAGGHAKGHGHGHKDGLAHVDGHDHSQGHGRGHSKGHGHGHARGDDETYGRSDPPGAPSLGNGASENGISAAALGSLNAANASATARDNASPNSMVGHIAAFAEAAESENINAAAEALAAKANKSITPEVVNEVSRLAEVEVSPETADAIAARAAEIQAAETEEPSAQSLPGGS